MARVISGSRTSMLQRIVVAGSCGWAALILVVSIATFGQVYADARWLVGAVTLVAVSGAVAASWLAAQSRFSWAAVVLVVSAIAPTCFLWVVNVVPLLLAAIALAAASEREARRRDTRG